MQAACGAGYTCRVDNQASLSIIIPVGPAETAHLELLRCLEAFFGADEFQATCQIVLSCCEAAPAGPSSLSAEGVDLIRTAGPAGRAVQLNRGVAASSGRCLWLLHADSRPTPDAMTCAAAFASAGKGSDPPAALGWFSLSFADDGPSLAALNAVGANLRSRIFRLPFGDQAWLLPRATFYAVGGFDEQFGLGEDLDFIRRARRAGIRLCRQRATIETSARKFRANGWLRTTLAHQWLTLRLWLKSAKRARKPLS